MEERGYWARYWQRRLGRRGVLRGAALAGAGLAAAAVVGCAEEERPTALPTAPGAAPAVKQPKRGGTLTHGGNTAATEGTGLDPMVNNSNFYARSFRLFYQGLLGYNARTYEVEPELAQKWEQVSPTEYLFTLQPAVKWHNKPPVGGRALRVQDVVSSLERARSPDPKILSRSFLVSADKIEITGTNTIRITSKAPDASFLFKLSADAVLTLAPEVLEKYGDKLPDLAEAGVGTGPFIITSAQQGVGATHVRNPDYWKPGLPYLDEMRVQFFADELARWAAFLAGKLDISAVPPDELKRYIASQGPGYAPDWYRSETGRQMLANVKKPPMTDPRVPRALRLLVDHEELIKTFSETDGRNASIFAASLYLWDLSHEEYYNYPEWKQPKDEAIKAAVDLLAAAGFNRSNPLKFEFDTYDSGTFLQIVQLVQAQWKRFSQGVVEVEIKPYPRAIVGQRQTQRQHTYLFTGLSGGISDVDSTLSQLYLTGGSRNFAEYSNPTLDALIEKQRSVFDVQQRKALVREITIYCLDNLPYTTPYNGQNLSALKPHVRGFAPEASVLNGRPYEAVWLDI